MAREELLGTPPEITNCGIKYIHTKQKQTILKEF
jgi:hypothetical protein